MHINPLSSIFLHNQCNDQNVIFLMKKFVVTFVTKNVRHEMVSCIWSWRKKTEKATLFLTPFYVSDKSLNRSWAILSSEKKVEVLNPQLKSWILSTYTATTLFCFCSFWWREKQKVPMTLPSQSIGRRKCDLFDEEICGHFCYQKNATWDGELHLILTKWTEKTTLFFTSF